MKGFTARERRIIAAAYRDAARICWEREWETRHSHLHETGNRIARRLAELMPIRAVQIIKYKCDLPRSSKGFHK